MAIMSSEIEYIPDYDGENEIVTTVIGIRSLDGIVFASDSQATSKSRKYKSIGVTKIFKVNDFVALAGSGDSDHVKRVVEEIKISFDNPTNQSTFQEKLESAILKLHKKYNTERSESLGLKDIKEYFRPVCIVGARLRDDFCLFQIRDDGWVEPIQDYIAIGSGSDLANFVLRQQSRAPATENKTLSDLSLSINLWIASYVISEIKDYDLQTGGKPKIALIHKNGFYQLSDNEILEYYNAVLKQVQNLAPTIASDKRFGPLIEKMFPRID
jgi:20S proteasome alpha/beta subunit